MQSGLENDFDAAILLVSKCLIEVRAFVQGSAVSYDKRGINLALLNPVEKLWQIALDRGLPIRKVKPRLIAEPIGILSRKPP